MLPPGTGSSQHGTAQDVQQRAAPRDEDGGAKLKSARDGEEAEQSEAVCLLPLTKGMGTLCTLCDG